MGGNDSDTGVHHLTSEEQEWMTRIQEHIHEHNDSIKPYVATLQLDPAREPPLYYEDDYTPPCHLIDPYGPCKHALS